MDLQQIRLGLVLREADVSVDVSSFANRLILQKAGYLLQQAGVSLGYHFSWYLRGPYSPDYTDDVFALAGASQNPANWTNGNWIRRRSVFWIGLKVFSSRHNRKATPCAGWNCWLPHFF